MTNSVRCLGVAPVSPIDLQKASHLAHRATRLLSRPPQSCDRCSLSSRPQAGVACVASISCILPRLPALAANSAMPCGHLDGMTLRNLEEIHALLQDVPCAGEHSWLGHFAITDGALPRIIGSCHASCPRARCLQAAARVEMTDHHFFFAASFSSSTIARLQRERNPPPRRAHRRCRRTCRRRNCGPSGRSRRPGRRSCIRSRGRPRLRPPRRRRSCARRNVRRPCRGCTPRPRSRRKARRCRR